MANVLVIVDLDGTVIKGNSAEKLFLQFLIRTKRLPLGRGLYFVAQFLWNTLTRGLDAAKGLSKGYLRGVSHSELAKWCQAFQPVLLRHLSAELVERIQALKSQGAVVLLLSGSLQMLLDLLKDALEIDQTIGVKLGMNNQICTGSATGVYPFGRNKAKIVKELYSNHSIDWQTSWAFADRYTDLPVLELVGNPVAVNPDRKLKRLAQKRGWEIIQT